jgi:hypothetical protein
MGSDRHVNHIEIEGTPAQLDLVRKGRFVVAVPHGTGPTLTNREVENARDVGTREHELR